MVPQRPPSMARSADCELDRAGEERMMIKEKIGTSVICALALVGAPLAAAQAAPADLTRTASATEGDDLRGGFIVPAIVIVAAILGVIILLMNDDNPPVSP